MATLTTNVISNVYNLGGNTACDTSTSTCAEGYGLYFPCLKDITRGQDVCFEFYVTDTATQDVADLRDVDALTFDLTGLYNCSYGTYSYPDYITSLQTEEYESVYSNDFGERTMCHLDVLALDVESTDSDPYFNKLENDYYSGTDVTVSAYDTSTHIFKGWAILTDEDECEDDSWDDYIVSTDNIYTFTIEADMELFAVYRPRKKYTIKIDSTNRNSHYIVTYNNIKYHIANKEDEIFDDSYDTYEEFLEGYHMIVECVPNPNFSNSDERYTFLRWKDGITDRCRLMCIGTDTKSFEDKYRNILLKAICGKFTTDELDENTLSYIDTFDKDGIHILTEFVNETTYEYAGDDYIDNVENVYLKFKDEDGYLFFNYGSLSVSSMEITDGIRIDVYAQAVEEDCESVVIVNEESLIQTITTDGYKMYSFYFRTCNQSDISITINGKCNVTKIEISKENIIDKGKAKFCLPSEITSNLATGALYVSGAIMVNGSSYGLAKTQIGTVNRLNKIIFTE